jgi:HAE1 family hydrophobic/amphiphilic exporter-1
VLTRDGVPVYMRDIADVSDATEDRRSFMRIDGINGIRMQVSKQSGTNTIQVADGVKKEVEKINARSRA